MKKTVKKLSSLVMAITLLCTSVNTLVSNAASCRGKNHGRQYVTYTNWHYEEDILAPNIYGATIKVGYTEVRWKFVECANCGATTQAKKETRRIYTNPLYKIYVDLGISK